MTSFSALSSNDSSVGETMNESCRPITSLITRISLVISKLLILLYTRQCLLLMLPFLKQNSALSFSFLGLWLSYFIYLLLQRFDDESRSKNLVNCGLNSLYYIHKVVYLSSLIKRLINSFKLESIDATNIVSEFVLLQNIKKKQLEDGWMFISYINDIDVTTR